MKTTLTTLTAALALSASVATAEVEVYKIDTAHSGVRFEINHFFNAVPGTFGNFEGEVHYDTANPEQSKAVATVYVDSVDTNNDKRDDHLKNEDFFTAEKYPKITFESTKWEKVGEKNYQVTGNLTMLGETNPVTLDVELLGFGEGRNGTKISGWKGTTEIDRRDWGMKGFNPPVGNKVDVTVSIQGHLAEDA